MAYTPEQRARMKETAMAVGGLSPEAAEEWVTEQETKAATSTQSADGRRVPYGPRRRDTPGTDTRAALDRLAVPVRPELSVEQLLKFATPETKEIWEKLSPDARAHPPKEVLDRLQGDAHSVLGQDRAMAERLAGDDEYALSGQDFAAAQRAIGSDAPGAQESRDSMERDTTKTAEELKREARRMEDPEIERIAAKMIDLGLIPEDYDRGAFEKAWADLVDKAADWHEANPGSYLTPEDMLDVYYGQRGTAGIGSTRKPGEPGGPSVTDVTSGVEISDSTQAWGMLRQMMRSQLGRNPSDAEVDSFQAALNDAQTRAPTITTRKTKTDLSGNQTVNSTKTGGMDAQSYTEQYVEDEMDGEFAAYQAASTYFNAFTEAIGRTV